MQCILFGPAPAITVFHKYHSFTLMRCSNCGLIFRANIAEKRMALLAKWQGERRGHEICCVASLKE